MFRTDLNHLLQSFDSQFMYKLMESVSFMGTIYMLLLTILVLIGGVNFRKGFLVLNILGWAVLFMLGAKNYFDYPRPLAVDATLENFGRDQTATNLVALQPVGFFDVFSKELLLKIRTSEVGRFGLPSGHTMIITAVWLGLSFLMRKRWLCVFSISLIILTMASRMYLGMHYLGDVSLGLILGVLFSVGFNVFYNRTNIADELTSNRMAKLFLLSPIVLLALSSVIPSFQGGTLIGLNFALFIILIYWGEPVIVQSAVKRVLNTVILVVLYFAMFFLTKKLNLPKEGLLSMLTFALFNFSTLFIFYLIGKKMGIYRNQDSQGSAN